MVSAQKPGSSRSTSDQAGHIIRFGMEKVRGKKEMHPANAIDQVTWVRPGVFPISLVPLLLPFVCEQLVSNDERKGLVDSVSFPDSVWFVGDRSRHSATRSRQPAEGAASQRSADAREQVRESYIARSCQDSHATGMQQSRLSTCHA